MEKRTFKGLEISLLGLGCMRFPRISEESQTIDYDKAEQIIDYAYHNGINYFDTAYVYNAGDSEKVTGKALSKYDRESYYLADKFPIWEVNEEADLEKVFNTHFERLGTDYIDFYLFHALDRANFEKHIQFNTYDFLQKKKAEGKIRHLGFSFHDSTDVFKEICETYKWDFTQLQINYLDWEDMDAKSMYETAKKHNIPVIVMEPVRGGKLADLCEESNKIFKDANPDASIASWALRYAGSFDHVFTVLSGMSDMAQIEENIALFSDFKKISADEQNVINKATDAFRRISEIPCTGCRYCIECPVKVDIPECFNIYNQRARDNAPWNTKILFNKRLEKANIKDCIECGQCEDLCPQGIKIRQDLKATIEKVNNW